MRTASLALFLTLFWLLFSGHYTPLLLALGVLTIVLTIYLAHRMQILDDEGHPLEFISGIVTYMPWLVVEILKSSLAVARIVLSPKLPIGPRVIQVDATQTTRTGVNIYGNSITLTPGTITVGVEGNTLTVHALTSDTADDLLGGEMDRRVTRLEGGA